MNIKLISKALHTLSLLSDEDVAIVFGLREASEDERGILMLALEPNSKPLKKSTERTIEHCAACDYTKRAKVHKDATVSGYHEFQPSTTTKKPAGKGGGGKSKHASSLAEKIAGTVGAKPDTDVFNMDDLCKCGHMVDNNVHHKQTDPEYHPFESSQAEAASGD